MGRKAKIVEEVVEQAVAPTVKSEKEILLDLYKELQDRGIRSISDLENQIARAN